MPLHDHECEACGEIFESQERYEDRVIDSQCCPGSTAKRIVSVPKLDIFKADYYEELGDDMPYITSKQQLADECQKRGLTSKHLEQGYHNNQPKRWI